MWAELLLIAALLLCVVPTSSSNLFSPSSSDNDVAKESRIIGGSHVSAMWMVIYAHDVYVIK